MHTPPKKPDFSNVQSTVTSSEQAIQGGAAA